MGWKALTANIGCDLAGAVCGMCLTAKGRSYSNVRLFDLKHN